MSQWEGVIGQNRVIKTLENLAYAKKIPNALLFIGNDGVGKHFVAKRFCALLNKNLGKEALYKINNLQEPYYKFIFPLPRGKNESPEDSPYSKLQQSQLENIKEEISRKTANPYYKIAINEAYSIKINSVREIKRFLSLSYEEEIYKIIEISEAHLMTHDAQNALLKSLEEPPERVVFILTAINSDSLLETIHSRCQTIFFDSLSNENVKEILRTYFIEETQENENIIEEVAPFSYGSVYKAIELINSDFECLIEKVISILRNSFIYKINSSIKELSDVISDVSGNSMKLFIQMLIIWLVDAERIRKGSEEILFKSKYDILEKFSNTIDGSKTQNTIMNLEKYSNMIDYNINLNIIAINIIFDLAALRFN